MAMFSGPNLPLLHHAKTDSHFSVPHISVKLLSHPLYPDDRCKKRLSISNIHSPLAFVTATILHRCRAASLLDTTNQFANLVCMKTETIGAFEAKTHFSQLLQRAQEGTVFIVTLRGKPVAQLGPNEQKTSQPVFGSAKGKVTVRDDFDEPLEDLAEYMS
jgi:prevent-host-death family protein